MDRTRLRRAAPGLVAGILAASFGGSPAGATLIVPNGNPTGAAAVGNVILNPSPATYVASSSSTWLLPALAAQGISAGNGWTINFVPLEGTITLQTYEAWAGTEPAENNCGPFDDGAVARPGSGGANVCLTFQPQGEDPSGSIVRWIQVIRTNSPTAFGTTNGANGGGGYKIYIDDGFTGQSSPPTDPFYGADDDDTSTGYHGNSVALSDAPFRSIAAGIDWQAQAFVAIGNLSAKQLTIFDGVQWGFQIIPEPGTFALVAMGALLLGAGRRARGVSVRPD